MLLLEPTDQRTLLNKGRKGALIIEVLGSPHLTTTSHFIQSVEKLL